MVSRLAKLVRPYQINLLLLGPYLPKILQIGKKKKIHMFSLLGLVLVLKVVE